jgi:16S rRNA processing protein RimM
MIVMGRVRAPFGVKGWVKLRPYTREIEGLLAYPQWWLQGEGGWQPRTLAEAAVHGDHLIARLDGCNDRDSAARLRGREVAIPRRLLQALAPGEFYWADLIGLEVVTLSGETLGVVEDLLETGGGAVLALGGEERRLLPFSEPVVRAVDCVAGRIVVDWEKDF